MQAQPVGQGAVVVLLADWVGQGGHAADIVGNRLQTLRVEGEPIDKKCLYATGFGVGHIDGVGGDDGILACQQPVGQRM